MTEKAWPLEENERKLCGWNAEREVECRVKSKVRLER